MALTKVIGDGLGTLTDKVEIDAADDLRLRFLNGSSFKAGIQVPTSTGDMITNSAVNDLAIRSQTNMLFATGGSTEHMRIDSTGAITKPLQPAFLLRPSSNQTNIAENTNVDIIFDTEIFDQNNDVSSNTFTAPITGRYFLSTTLYTSQIDTPNSYVEAKIVTSNRTYYDTIDPRIFVQDPDYFTFKIATLADMDASDTAKIQIITHNAGSQQMDLVAGACNFSGCLIC